ncbi:MAG: hypothetical protein JWR30_2226, partial [Conexibacter sp.]|nr:hypothetical protein [Conexibacter sp.]
MSRMSARPEAAQLLAHWRLRAVVVL